MWLCPSCRYSSDSDDYDSEYDSEEDEIADSVDNTSGDGLEEEEHENMENSHGLGKIDGKH